MAVHESNTNARMGVEIIRVFVFDSWAAIATFLT